MNAYSSRNDLIRDIESHIEIIFECFELDDSVMVTTAAASSSSSSSSSNVAAGEVNSIEEIVTEGAKNQEIADKSDEKTSPAAVVVAVEEKEKNDTEKKE